MGSPIDKLSIESLKGQVESSRLVCDDLATQFERAQASTEKTEIAHQYAEALRQTHALQCLLELWEREEQGQS